MQKPLKLMEYIIILKSYIMITLNRVWFSDYTVVHISYLSAELCKYDAAAAAVKAARPPTTIMMAVIKQHYTRLVAV